MKTQQISIFIENKSGRLAKIMTILGESEINILALSLADASDFGILRLIVKDIDKALKILKNKGFTVAVTDVMAIEIIDIGKFLIIMEKAGLNVEYVYSFIHKSGEICKLVFSFDDLDKAIKVMNGFK